MISEKCIEEYLKMFPEHIVFYMEPGDLVCISDGFDDVVQPFDETDATFMERLRRCNKRKNVFFDEWERAEDDPDVIY